MRLARLPILDPIARDIDVLCHTYKCIFVHIPKVAGQSIEHVFLHLHDLSWKTRCPLLLRPNSDPAAGPPRLAHLKASQYVACGHVTPEQFRGYFKFSFVRNPWDRVVSFYKYSKRGRGLSFNTFLSRELVGREWHKRYWFVGPQHEFLFDAQRTPLVDFIGRFETLQADFDHVCRRIGIPPTALPHVNRSRGLSPLYPLIALRSLLSTRRARPVSRYAAYYDEASRRVVERLYEKDIEIFKYRFGP